MKSSVLDPSPYKSGYGALNCRLLESFLNDPASHERLFLAKSFMKKQRQENDYVPKHLRNPYNWEYYRHNDSPQSYESCLIPTEETGSKKPIHDSPSQSGSTVHESTIEEKNSHPEKTVPRRVPKFVIENGLFQRRRQRRKRNQSLMDNFKHAILKKHHSTQSKVEVSEHETIERDNIPPKIIEDRRESNTIISLIDFNTKPKIKKNRNISCEITPSQKNRSIVSQSFNSNISQNEISKTLYHYRTSKKDACLSTNDIASKKSIENSPPEKSEAEVAQKSIWRYSSKHQDARTHRRFLTPSKVRGIDYIKETEDHKANKHFVVKGRTRKAWDIFEKYISNRCHKINKARWTTKKIVNSNISLNDHFQIKSYLKNSAYQRNLATAASKVRPKIEEFFDFVPGNGGPGNKGFPLHKNGKRLYFEEKLMKKCSEANNVPILMQNSEEDKISHTPTLFKRAKSKTEHCQSFFVSKKTPSDIAFPTINSHYKKREKANKHYEFIDNESDENFINETIESRVEDGQKTKLKLIVNLNLPIISKKHGNYEEAQINKPKILIEDFL